MALELERWKEILSSIEAQSDLDRSNIVDKIKEELQKVDPNMCQEWENKQFDINYEFTAYRILPQYDLGRMATLLHIVAASNSNENVMQALIEAGADVNARGIFELAPLHFAAANGHLEIVKYLIEAGADVHSCDVGGQTPLHSAAANGHLEIVKYLIEAGADIHSWDADGQTPLHLAVRKQKDEVAKFLIAHEIKLEGSGTQKPNYLAQYNADFEREMSEYWDGCLNEVERMKEEKIDRGITFYDILISRNNKLAFYIRNESVAKVLREGSYQSKFPMYANDLERQFEMGKQRLDALNTGEIVTKHFGNLSKGGPFNLEIAKNLDNKDIKSLRKAAIQTMDCKSGESSKKIPQSLGNVDIENLSKTVKRV